ncbi:hypothetical protein [Streptomyces sp. NRRL B-24484]|uniref:hypothetical protein n=1 Tax=Streptomyces sp. NRRL B-24484 TaxID=1463833 RepID=UPI0004BECED0|nr:hypothetical protein [Streptomyces sp. NRRL B-24484]
MSLTPDTALRVLPLLLLAVLLILLMLPITRNSRAVRALRATVAPWLPPLGKRGSPLRVRRALGAVIALVGLACFTQADNPLLAVAAYALAAAGILLYGA